MELACVIPSHSLALIAELVQEQESPESEPPHEPRKAHKRQRSDAAQRQLHDGVVWPGVLGVAGVAGQEEMRRGGDDDGEEEEHEPGEARSEHAGLVYAGPSEVGSEEVELVPHVRYASHVLVPSLQQSLAVVVVVVVHVPH